MTAEHRLSFELTDIVTVTLECKNCGVRLSAYPGKLRMQMMGKCPACAHQWLILDPTQEEVLLHPVSRILVALPTALANVKDLGVRVLLEFPDQVAA